MTNAFLVYRGEDGHNTMTFCEGLNPDFAKKALRQFSDDKKAFKLCSSGYVGLETGAVELDGSTSYKDFFIGDPVFNSFDYDNIKDYILKNYGRVGGVDYIYVWDGDQWIYASAYKKGWFALATNAKIQAKRAKNTMLEALIKADKSLGK